MGLFSDQQKLPIDAIAKLAHCNPFLPERIELERSALGDQFVDDDVSAWSKDAAWDHERTNVERLRATADSLIQQVQDQIVREDTVSTDDLQRYADLALYVLYYRYWRDFDALVTESGKDKKVVKCWDAFQRDYQQLLVLPGLEMPSELNAEHVFAVFYQVRRAFHHIFHYVLGGSAPAAQLRASIWQSIFTHDFRRYRRTMYQKMSDVATLITGPSGTGKELVARAIGSSRYIPFDSTSKKFVAEYRDTFRPVHLAAMTPTLLESELFGHRRGAFTGADEDRIGWFESCGPYGTVFLDEIGEVACDVQVKLLRVLQSREFQRVGETTSRPFEGKIVAATNRVLTDEIAASNFREDFYFRLCSDTIQTPSLRAQLDDCPDDLQNFILYISTRIAGSEAEEVTQEAVQWIEQHLGRSYAWRGNIRELEQCVRSIVIHGYYNHPSPAGNGSQSDPKQSILAGAESGDLTADQLLQEYCALVYARTGSYEKAAEMLDMDRRTVKSKIVKRAERLDDNSSSDHIA